MATNILLRIDEETKDRIRKLAEQDKRSVTNFILCAIDKRIEEANNGN